MTSAELTAKTRKETDISSGMELLDTQCEIWDYHCGWHQDSSFLRYDIMQFGRWVPPFLQTCLENSR